MRVKKAQEPVRPRIVQELEQEQAFDDLTDETPERKIPRPRIVLPDSIVSTIIANENAGEED